MSPHLGIDEQPVVDLLARLEFDVGLVLGGEHSRMSAVPAVVVGDVGEVPDPAVEPQQIERGRADEVDRHLVGAEEVPHLRDVAQAGAGRAPCRRGNAASVPTLTASESLRRRV